MVFTHFRNLSLSVSFFDLLGFLVPAIFLEKHIVRRRTWQTSSSWNDPLPSNVDSRFATALCDPNLIVYSSNFSFACTYLLLQSVWRFISFTCPFSFLVILVIVCSQKFEYCLAVLGLCFSG